MYTIHFPPASKQNYHPLLLILLLLPMLSGGCVVKDMSNVVKHSFTGEHFLMTEQFSRGEKNFQQEVIENPDSSLANYYYARFLLADKHYKDALTYLTKAHSLDSDNPDYHFWLGVIYGNLGKRVAERKSYLKALSLKEDHLQSLIYLGHNQLNSGEYTKGLQSYTKALALWPASPASLYNRALILTKLGRKPEAVDGWLEYLSYYPSGAMARKAVTHLNSLDNFSFRNYHFLSRTVTVEKIYFAPFSPDLDRDSYPSLELIGAIFHNMKKGRLQIVVYQLKNKELARQKALNIKKFLLKKFPDIKTGNIGVSWFDSPEVIKSSSGNKKIYDSVQFFITG
ncbi:MAG: tetratricopeptide repeat protein [Deltaproteobacteria bacterium]|nr:tetratricopeptide repeat protein [Deltaproteobacteria bacterium]